MAPDFVEELITAQNVRAKDTGNWVLATAQYQKCKNSKAEITGHGVRAAYSTQVLLVKGKIPLATSTEFAFPA
jgi:hypothetical protein